MSTEAVLDRLMEKFDLLGGRHYGENVTQRSHMEQAAHLAATDGAPAALIAAALLHDFGHFLQRKGENAARAGIDARHEAIGANYLARFFPDEVVQPILLHVNAKRFLCTTDKDYLLGLSEASQQSLVLQGGLMSAAERSEFARHPYRADALRLRRYDDLAKQTDADVPGVASYRGMLIDLMQHPAGRMRAALPR
ncbi:MAG TPA: HD domain-containing protein [Rhizomicrobium sp.]|jgi:phosphonate degradation associated HDIG domain protein